MYQVNIESISAALAEGLEDMLAVHWQEVAHPTDPAFSPNWPAILEAERQKRLVPIVIRSGMRMIGYSCFCVTEHLHHQHSRIATNDTIYVDKDEGRGLAGVKLIRESELLLRMRGAQSIVYGTNLHVLSRDGSHDRVGRLLTHLGYSHVANTYAKRL